jgi:Kef-type K+ transport system membrane component KefB
MLISTATFTALGLPVGQGLGTQILVRFFGATPELAGIRSLDEAVVIGAALSLSSSAFVLQLLQEKNQLATNWGAATLGILLLQVLPLPSWH